MGSGRASGLFTLEFRKARSQLIRKSLILRGALLIPFGHDSVVCAGGDCAINETCVKFIRLNLELEQLLFRGLLGHDLRDPLTGAKMCNKRTVLAHDYLQTYQMLSVCYGERVAQPRAPVKRAPRRATPRRAEISQQ
jgi:hypothetical protein